MNKHNKSFRFFLMFCRELTEEDIEYFLAQILDVSIISRRKKARKPMMCTVAIVP
jgi:hypothetical protein